MAEPWTQRVSVSWRTMVSYYENRLRVMRSFEDEGLLWQMRVAPDDISARLGDANHLVRFSPDRLEVALLQPTGDVARLEDAVERAWEAVVPQRLARPRLSFQWLVALDMTYEEAKATAISSLFGSPPDVAFTDWSSILNGEESEPESSYIAEFGIVDSAEAPRRLGRQAGLFRGQGTETPVTIWPTETLPAVAFFLDGAWQITGTMEQTAQGIVTTWRETRDRARRVVFTLMDAVGLKYE